MRSDALNTLTRPYIYIYIFFFFKQKGKERRIRSALKRSVDTSNSGSQSNERKANEIYSLQTLTKWRSEPKHWKITKGVILFDDSFTFFFWIIIMVCSVSFWSGLVKWKQYYALCRLVNQPIININHLPLYTHLTSFSSFSSWAIFFFVVFPLHFPRFI